MMAMEYRRRLAYLDDELHNENVKILQFLCEPLVGGSACKASASVMELFESLERKQLLSQNKMEVINEALQIMQRLDLLDIHTDLAQAQSRPVVGRICICPFRAMLVDISEDLPEDELNRIRFVYQKVPKKSKIEDGLDLFKIMLQNSDLKATNLTLLETLLTQQGRKDLAEKVKDFQDKYILDGQYTWRPRSTAFVCQEDEYELPAPTMQITPTGSDAGQQESTGAALTPLNTINSNWEVNSNAHALNTPHTAEPMDTSQPWTTPTQQQQYNVGMATSTTYNALEDHFSEIHYASNVNKAANLSSAQPTSEGASANPGSLVSGVPESATLTQLGVKTSSSDMGASSYGSLVVSGATASSAEVATGDALPCYKMDTNPRGLCIIIDIENYTYDPHDIDAKDLKKREGSHIDSEAFKNTFEKLHFIVETHKDLNKHDLEALLLRVSQLDHSNYDCFVTCIMTHGGSGYIYSGDGKKVNLVDILSHFRSQKCPTLHDKPKLFFLACCQGTAEQPGHVTQEDIATDGPDNPVNSIPGNDFLLGFATPPGYVSYRSKTKGTWYITNLTEVFDKYADREDLMTLLTRVNAAVSQESHTKPDVPHPLKQVPAPQFTLLKRLMFLPLSN